MRVVNIVGPERDQSRPLKDTVDTAFEREILSQALLLDQRAAEGRRAAERAAALADASVTHLVIAARWSSDHAATYLQYLAGQRLGLLCALATPSLYVDPLHVNLSGVMVVGISQSGRSPDVVSVLASARAQSRPTVAITNDVNSALALQADVVIPLLVGEEVSLAATKTMLASLQSAAQLVQALANDGHELSDEQELPSMIETTSAWSLEHVEGVVDRLSLTGLTVVGRGLGLCAAEECALKIREVAGIRAEAYATPDLLHGPIGADGRGASMWLIVSDEIDDESVADLLARARASGLTTLVSRSGERAATTADVELVLPVRAPNWITPFLTIVLGQVMALRLGELHRRPIDQPPGLNKITLTN
jgi:glucosamine--fructose-6-phosphate aminotransferase (isomerizing)